MKKQLLIAAVAASMTSVAMADISISGASKVNANGGTYTMEADVTITGKSGGTSVVAQIGLDSRNVNTTSICTDAVVAVAATDTEEAVAAADAVNCTVAQSNVVEQLYATSSIAGINVKVGTWKSGKGELGQNAAGSARVAASTSFGGVKLSYSDRTGAGNTDVAISGTIAGLAISHKIKDTATETKVSGTMGGVNASVHTKEDDSGDTDTSYTLKTEVQGIALTYVNTTADGTGTSMDGFIGKTTGVNAASAIGISTSIAGNKVTLKSIDIDGTDNKKLIVTRALASGATFEATYDDNADTLDLELAVKF